jgi:hypothetical protein
VVRQRIHPIAAQACNHEHVGEHALAMQALGDRKQVGAVHQVNLVQGEDRLRAGFLQSRNDALVVLVPFSGPAPRPCVDKMHDRVGILGSRPRRPYHRPVEPLAR